jgi:hypothetical protein
MKYLEDCRRKVANYVYKETKGMPSMPRFREAKKVISEYRKSTSDLRGTLDLMLTYVERGHAFTNDFGDIDEPFYDKLINMLEHFAVEMRRSPAKYELYEMFRSRLMAMRKTSDIGWGYGDFIQEIVDELEELFTAKLIVAAGVPQGDDIAAGVAVRYGGGIVRVAAECFR